MQPVAVSSLQKCREGKKGGFFVRKMSRAATCAATIRKELKEKFPGVKFSVRSETYAGGDSVRINWTDGPEHAEVEAIAAKYEAGSFDGMTDMYVYNRDRDPDRPCVKFVFVSKEFSDEATEDLKAKAEKLLVDHHCKFRGKFQPHQAEEAIRAELQRREARKEQMQEKARKMPDNVIQVDFVRRKVI